MVKPTMRITLGALAFWAASLCWAASDNSVSVAGVPNPLGDPALSVPSESGPAKAAPAADEAVSQGKPQSAVAPDVKPLLGEAFIVQNHLQVYLNRPAAIYVYNARGQQVFHTDSHSALESVPLLGMSTGFLYLTVRSGQTELTKKLVYTGK